jgi:WD40 repeat protein
MKPNVAIQSIHHWDGSRSVGGIETNPTRPNKRDTVMKIRSLVLSLSFFIIALLACNPLGTATLTPSASPTTPRHLEPSSKTATPDQPIIITATQADGTRALDPEGPWLLAIDESSVSAFNTDGSGQTELLASGPQSFALSPDGRKLAYITDTHPEDESQGFQLRLLVLPSGPDELITELQNPDLLPPDEPGIGDPVTESFRAIDMTLPRWSHDGNYIAFIGQQDGPSADLYVYDVREQEITQLTDGPSQAYGISWSPGDDFIFHAGVDSFGTGAGYADVGSWIARRDDTGIIDVSTGGGSDQAMAWYADDGVLLASWRQPCGMADLQSFDIEAAAFEMIWPYFLEFLAFDDNTGNLAFLVPEGFDTCTEGGQPTGLFYMADVDDEPEAVSDQAFESLLLDPSTPGAFLLRDDSGIYRFQPPDRITFLGETPSMVPLYASRSDTWLWFGSWRENTGLWVGQLPGTPRKVSDAGVMNATWSPDGTTVLFVGSSDSRLYTATAPGFEPRPISPSVVFDGLTYLRWAGR